MRSKKAGKVSKKRAVKRSGNKKGGVRKASKKAVKKTGAKKKKIAGKPAGYSHSRGGILIPEKDSTPIPVSKLKKGFSSAKKEIQSIVEAIIMTMADDYVISEIELAASFSADGKFLGIGVGGAATITIRISPDGG